MPSPSNGFPFSQPKYHQPDSPKKEEGNWGRGVRKGGKARQLNLKGGKLRPQRVVLMEDFYFFLIFFLHACFFSKAVL